LEEINKIDIYLMKYSPPKSLINNLKHPDINIHIFKDLNKLIQTLKQYSNPITEFEHKIIIIYSKTPLNNIVQIIRRIKEDPIIKTVPVFVISEPADKKEINDAYCHNLNGYIVLPRDPESFKHSIKSFKDFYLNNVKLP